MINPRIFGIVLVLGAVATLIFIVTTSQNAIASIFDEEADVGVEEAAEAGNATTTTMTTNQTANGNMPAPEFLSIQNAQSGSIFQNNSTAYTLQLNNVSDEMIMFSDRPDRIVLSVSTDDFIGNWTSGANSFATDPPNAVLILEDDFAQKQGLDIVALSGPQYDIATNMLTYSIISGNKISIYSTADFRRPILFIDRTCGPPPPLSADVVCR